MARPFWFTADIERLIANCLNCEPAELECYGVRLDWQAGWLIGVLLVPASFLLAALALVRLLRRRARHETRLLLDKVSFFFFQLFVLSLVFFVLRKVVCWHAKEKKRKEEMKARVARDTTTHKLGKKREKRKGTWCRK